MYHNFYKIKKVSFYSYLAEYFYDDLVLDFVKNFLHVLKRFFLFSFFSVNVMHYIDWFSNVRLDLFSEDKLWCIVPCIYLFIWVDNIFVKDFCIYLMRNIGLWLFVSYNTLVLVLRYPCLTKWDGNYCLLLYFLKDLVYDWYYFLLKIYI